MFSVVKLLTFTDAVQPDDRPKLAGALLKFGRALPGARSVLAEPTLPGVYNGGDLIWRVQFHDEQSYDVALRSLAWKDASNIFSDRMVVKALQSAAYMPLRSGGRAPGRGVYRVALFCANQNATPERQRAWAVEVSDMPRHVQTIRSWQFGLSTDVQGSRPWTHVWEQEYETLDGLTGAYMMHPCHWAQVDRWFDPEFPEWLVDQEICHTFCVTTDPAIILP